jgi:hypothetical protein
MIGRKSTLKTLLAVLRTPELNVACVQTTTFHQGRQARWGVAWTFDEVAAADYKRRNRITHVEETGGGPPKSSFQFRIKADSAIVSHVLYLLQSFCLCTLPIPLLLLLL